METFVFGALGAVAPEIIRWYRIAHSETPDEWKRISFWAATAMYMGVAGMFAAVVAQPEAYAALAAGASTEFAAAGLLRPNPSIPLEELSSRAASPFRTTLVSLRRHAAYLTQNG